MSDRSGGAADIERAASAGDLACEALDGGGGGGIEHRNAGEIDDIGLRMLANALERGSHAGGGAEEEGAGNPVDDNVRIGRNGGIVAGTAVAVFLVRPVR